MPEQKCIICGNIVRFNRGQKVATCEYCETIQEYDGEVEPVTYAEPAVENTSSLERARKITVEETRNSMKFTPVKETYVGTTASSKSTMRFGEIDELEKREYPSEETPKSSGLVRAICIILLIAMVVGVIIVLVKNLDNDTDTQEDTVVSTEWIPSASAEINTLEVGQEVCDINIESDESWKYSAVLDCVYYYDDDGEYVLLESYDTIDEEREYYVVVDFVPESGYEFDEYTDYYINGEHAGAYDGDTTREVSMYAVDNSKETIQIGSSWSKTQISINNYDTSCKELNRSAVDCVEFTVDYEVVDVKSGYMSRNLCVYVRKTDGNFHKVKTFYYTGSGSTEQTVSFDTPTTIDAVAVVPESSSGTESLNWTHTISMSDFVVKK